MAIWDDIKNTMTGGAQHDLNQGYDQAQDYMNPYYQGGTQSFNRWRGDTYHMGNMLDQYGNPANYQWSHINQSPMSYYNSIMGSYSESPEAKYQQEQAMRGANSAAAASGMMGSGAFFNKVQQNANDISQRDRGQYFDRVMGVNDAQTRALENFQRQRELYSQHLANQSQMGYGAAGQMSNNSMRHGQDQAYWDNEGFNNTAGIASGIAQAGNNRFHWWDAQPRRR